jgi:molecular chaperone DnaK
MNASQDQRKRALVEARNAADGAIYGAEKALADIPQIPETERARMTEMIQELKSAAQGQDENRIRQLADQLNHQMQQLSTAAYQAHNSAAGGADPRAHAGASPNQEHGRRGTDDDDVVDAEYQEVA